jgi:pimeloyl-ACP methyl ester carboxylesterase
MQGLMTTSAPDILLVHGAWLGPRSWDHIAAHYAKAGLSCLAPSWPEDDRRYAELRAQPSERLATIGVQEIASHYEQILRAMPEQPLLIGHSFGGLIVQILLDRGVGSGAIAIHPAPPRGVFPTPRAVRASFGPLSTWGGWRKVLTIPYEGFVDGFVHALPEAARRQAYEEHVIPTPGRPFFQAAFAPFIRATYVDYRNSKRAPLLITGGDRDRTVPLAMNRANHRNYARSTAVTDFLEMKHRSHWVCAEPGWEEVADRAIAWAKERGALRATTSTAQARDFTSATS